MLHRILKVLIHEITESLLERVEYAQRVGYDAWKFNQSDSPLLPSSKT